jgi:hypothetical protein
MRALFAPSAGFSFWPSGDSQIIHSTEEVGPGTEVTGQAGDAQTGQMATPFKAQ